jgi:hypothetical protein
MPYCTLEHEPLDDMPSDLMRPDDSDDWEGPPMPEYSERDEESYLEMCRDDWRLGI